MMRFYKVRAANRDTGNTATLRVIAYSPEAAEREANADGWIVSTVDPEPSWIPAVTTDEAAVIADIMATAICRGIFRFVVVMTALGLLGLIVGIILDRAY